MALHAVPDAATAADEYAVTSKWITGAAADSVYRFGKQQFSRSIDPRSQSEDLGDDAVKASGYGIANLKYILGNMNAWISARTPISPSGAPSTTRCSRSISAT